MIQQAYTVLQSYESGKREGRKSPAIHVGDFRLLFFIAELIPIEPELQGRWIDFINI